MRPKIGFIDPVIIDNLGADRVGKCSCNRQLAGPGKAQQIKENIVHRCNRLRPKTTSGKTQYEWYPNSLRASILLRTASVGSASEAVILDARASQRTRMAHTVFFQSQPPDVHRFVMNAIEPLWLEPKADAAVRQAIKQQFPGRFSDDEIGLLIHCAMFIMK